ncbi:uncharacterized protein LOC142525461 isoform X1 [Primulina tabacum]|uniref:uncharacterized protein LOC142525461 isoform X1 n=1 Tax=Primulina tabacum TaxID=48773 RepID=UPI003F5934A9
MIGYGRPPQHTVALDLNLADVQKKRLLLWIMGTRKRAMSPEVEDGEIVATGRVMSVKIYTGLIRDHRVFLHPAPRTAVAHLAEWHSIQEPNSHSEKMGVV